MTTRETWLSYSCLPGPNSDHARCLSGPDHPSPLGIAPVCTCSHHTQANWDVRKFAGFVNVTGLEEKFRDG